MKSHVIINFRIWFFALFFGALTGFGAFLCIHEFSIFAFFSVIVMFITTIGWLLLFPYYMIVTEQNVTICYAFGKKIFARWEDINEIQIHTYKFLKDYRFVPMSGKRYFFQNGSFPRSRRLRKLIERYWSGTIR